MAAGDLTVFNTAKQYFTNGTLDLDSTTFKVMFVTNATVPAATTATPIKADFTEVAAGGNYVAGGFNFAPVLTESGGVLTFNDNASDIAMVKDAANPTNVAYAVLYGVGTLNAIVDPCLCFVEINTTGADGTAGAINLTWGAGGLFTIT